jgi:excinuclease ABC subunit C
VMTPQLEDKLKQLPDAPGVYFHKNAQDEIIYVGKAAVLRNRVRQYFQKSRTRDPKTDALVHDIADTDWMIVESELEALFLEAEMIRRYMPRYNILLRDDKSMSYIRIDYDSDYPTVSTTRRPLDDGARYFGPYSSTTAIRQALKILRRIFPFATRQLAGQKRATLHYHLGLDPGLEEGRTTIEAYRANLRKLILVIEGKRKNIEHELERDMKHAAKAQEFEQAARIRNQLFTLQKINKQVIFSDKEFMDISKDHALNELVDLLSLERFPRRIEGYDISHMSGTNVVASMVVFTHGVSDKSEYRKFKTRKDHNNDFFNMNETLGRRLSEKNLKAWGKPDLILIDGGKGQLDAALKARDEAGCKMPFIGLAKREEQIVIDKNRSNLTLNIDVLHKLGGYTTESEDFILVNVPHTTNVVKLLQRIRDESHRFAVSYHSVLKVKHQTMSLLDEIPGVGPATRKKLLKEFGSLRAIQAAGSKDLEASIGSIKGQYIFKYLHDQSIGIPKPSSVETSSS